MDKQKLMLFSERKELAEEYEKWINTPLDDGSKIKDCALSVITFMQIKGFCKIPENAVVLTRDKYEYKEKKIYRNGEHIGYIDFSVYRDIRALGIGDFEIIDKRKGYGTAVINDIVDKYKTAYDLIYCFVDKENHGAIEFYKKVGDICYDKINDKGQYQVILYENETKKVRKETAKKFARLVEFHSVATVRDGVEYFTISALGLKEILAEEFGFKYDEILEEITGGR